MSDSADTSPAVDAGPASPGPGARLKSARELKGLALGAVAESLHVAPRIVAAMEANEFGAFDAPVYAKGFLRKYAGVLGIPADEVLAAYEAVAGELSHPTLIPAMNVAPTKAALPKVPVVPVLIAAAVALLLGGGYWWWSARPRPATPAVAADAQPAAEREPAPASGTLVPTQQPGQADEAPAVVPLPAVAESAPRPAAAAPLPLPAPATTPSSARHRATAGGAAREDGLVIHGVRECWAEVYAPSGARLVYDMVHPGETVNVPGPGPWRVFLGFADGARLTVGEHAVVVPPSRRAAATARFVVARDGAAQ